MDLADFYEEFPTYLHHCLTCRVFSTPEDVPESVTEFVQFCVEKALEDLHVGRGKENTSYYDRRNARRKIS